MRAWSQVSNSDPALTLEQCLGQAGLAGATVTRGLRSCVAEKSSQDCHHGATAVANLAYLTSLPRLSTLNSGLKGMLKNKEREKKFIKSKFSTNELCAWEQTGSRP